ncbi:hypothetical protein D3C71_1955380 [compost metagenome]
MALAIGVVIAAQALEQPVELLQPGARRCAVIGLGHLRQLGQCRYTQWVQRDLGAHDVAFDGK